MRIRHQPPLGVGRRRQRRPLAARPTSSLHQQRGTHPTMTEFCGVLSRRSRLNFNSTKPRWRARRRVGILGMPRRKAYYDCADLAIAPQAFSVTLSAIGAFILLISGLLFLYTLARLPPSRPRCASQLMDSYLRDDFPLNASSHRAIPDVALPEGYRPQDLPLRPERHIPNSIATMRTRLINTLIRTLPRCPCCGVNPATYRRQLCAVRLRDAGFAGGRSSGTCPSGNT